MSEHGAGEATSGGDGGVIANLLAKVSFAINSQGLDHLGHKLEGIKHAVEALVAFKAVEAIHSLGERFAGLGESLESSALQAGITTTELQKLQYAASQNAISAEDMTMGLTRLGRVMFQAQKGSKQAVDTFARLGISKEQIDSFSSTKDAFFAVADGVNRLGTQQEKLGVTQQILGRGGAKYLKLFAAGTEEITALGERAQKVGAVISHKSIENLAKFEDAASSFKLVLRGFLANVAGTFIPAITRGLRALEDAWGHNKNVVISVLGKIGDTLGLFGYSAMLTLQNLSEFVHRIIYGGTGIAGSLHGLLRIVTNVFGSIAGQLSTSIGELISNGSFSVFLEAIKGLVASIAGTGADVAGLFSQLASGLGSLGGVDTKGIDKTTTSLNLLLAVLTAIVQMAGLALRGVGDILSGRFFSAAKDATSAYIESKKYEQGSVLGFMARHNGNFAQGMSAAGVMASSGPGALSDSFVAPPAPAASGPMQMTSTINVTAAPGMSTDELAKKVADRQSANFSQMLRESRRDFASPMVY